VPIFAAHLSAHVFGISMTDPLIVVEGSLRLPSVRPLADPSLHYGQEWSTARSRTSHKQAEVSLFAAHMRTSYVEAITLSGTGSSYRSASIWAIFADGPMRLSMLRLMEEIKSGVATDKETAPKTEPIQLAVAEPAKEQAAPESRMPTFLKTAIAVACAALVSWLILGQQRHSSSSIEPAAYGTKHAGMDIQQNEPPSTLSPSPASAAMVVAAQQAAVAAPASEASAPRAVIAASSPFVDTAPPAPVTPNAATAQTTRQAKRHDLRATRQARTSYAETSIRTQAHHKRLRWTSTGRTASVPRTQYHATADDYQALATTPRTRATIRRNTPASKSNSSIDTIALYNMLQHSATLDSNVSSSDASAK
jgi:hypothetical protein